jgi:hypothetical protein
MTAYSKACPNGDCRCPVASDDVFCPHCGVQLVATMEQGLTQLARQEAKLAQLDLVVPSSAPGPAVAGVPATDAVSSDCKDLEVRYNNGCVFVINMQSTFDLEIRPRVDGIRSLSVEIWQSGRRLLHEAPMLMARMGVVVPVSLNYMPTSSPGNAAFTIVVQYQHEGRWNRFAAVKKHTIYSGKEDPRMVCDKLVVEIKNNIQQGHAGDMKVDQDFRSLKELVGRQNHLSLDKEFIELINRHAFWSNLCLQECEVDGKGLGDSAGLPKVLTFKPDSGPEVLWFNQPLLRVGRNRQCELVARHYKSDGSEDGEASRLISQFHAWFEWQNGVAAVADLGLRPGESRPRPSMAGVWIDGRRIPSGSRSVFQPGTEYTVALGGAESVKEQPFTMKVRAWSLSELPRHGRLGETFNASVSACLTVRPITDGGDRVFVLVNHALCLGWVDSRWGAACICIDNGCLRLCEEGLCFPIEAGHAFKAAGHRFDLIDTLSQTKK